jgi:hypothetical protein
MEEACRRGLQFRKLGVEQSLSGPQVQFLCHLADADQKKQITVCGIVENVTFTGKNGKILTGTDRDLEFKAGGDQFVKVGDRVTMQFCEQRRTKSGVDSHSCTGQIKSFAVSIMDDGKAVVRALLSGVKGMPEGVPAELEDLKKAE